MRSAGSLFGPTVNSSRLQIAFIVVSYWALL